MEIRFPARRLHFLSSGLNSESSGSFHMRLEDFFSSVAVVAYSVGEPYK